MVAVAIVYVAALDRIGREPSAVGIVGGRGADFVFDVEVGYLVDEVVDVFAALGADLVFGLEERLFADGAAEEIGDNYGVCSRGISRMRVARSGGISR